jgi:hypothetical protein
VFDVDSAVEVAIGDGPWMRGNITSDSTHPDQTGYHLEKSSGVIDPVLIFR